VLPPNGEDARVSRDTLRELSTARVAALAIWFGRVDPLPLAGGITNQNFTVEDRGRRYVVRVGNDILVHGVVRANELAASRAAHLAGLSPGVVHAEPGILVLDFIDGRTFTPEDVRNPANFERLVDMVRRCHRDIPQHLRGPAAMFWVFHVVRDYAHTLRDGNSRHVFLLPDLLARAVRLEAAVGPIDVVFGHNDLLAANFIDDGHRLWLLDWEYAGYNSPLFDLGGLASNSELSPEQAEQALSLYFDKPLDDQLRRRASAMTAASLLRETMWSMVSEIHSTVDFDYTAYTAENLRRFEAAYASYQTMDRA
jgi:thiamine kinase-like enzyme